MSGRGSYFYLSYAHSPPLADSLREGILTAPGQEDLASAPDRWVSTLFGDLTRAVLRHASKQIRAVPGFFDQEITPGSDWKAMITRALGTAQVFVPLYSPDYLTRSWPGREWACFEERVRAAGVSDPMRRFAPVLWIPLPAGRWAEGLQEARELAPPAAAGDYRGNGLQALLRLKPYRHSYELVVDELATRIVRLAEQSPIEASAVPDIDRVASAFGAPSDAVRFAVVVAAPAVPGIPAGPDRAAYGTVGSAWRPFARDQELPIAGYAAMVGEQFDFAVEVREIEKAGDLRRTPGVVLIDPWFAATAQGLSTLRGFIRDLPSWVLPVLLEADSDPRTSQLAEKVRTILDEPARPRSEPARRALKGVTSLRNFVTLMPFLVAAAEREYLRRGPIRRSVVQPGYRPRIVGDGNPAGPVPQQATMESTTRENPDA